MPCLPIQGRMVPLDEVDPHCPTFQFAAAYEDYISSSCLFALCRDTPRLRRLIYARNHSRYHVAIVCDTSRALHVGIYNMSQEHWVRFVELVEEAFQKTKRLEVEARLLPWQKHGF